MSSKGHVRIVAELIGLPSGPGAACTAIETTLRSLWVIAVTLIVFGVILEIADHSGAKRRKVTDLAVLHSVTPHSVIYGFAQSLALIPGVSRSGGIIAAGLFLGYERSAAVWSRSCGFALATVRASPRSGLEMSATSATSGWRPSGGRDSLPRLCPRASTPFTPFRSRSGTT